MKENFLTNKLTHLYEVFSQNKLTCLYIAVAIFLWCLVLGIEGLVVIGSLLLFCVLPVILILMAVDWLEEHKVKYRVSRKLVKALISTVVTVFYIAIFLDILGTILE